MLGGEYMNSFSQEIEDNFLTFLLDTPHLQEHIRSLCRYLSKNTGCDKMLFYEIDSVLMKSRIIFTYNLDTEIFRTLVGDMSSFWSIESFINRHKGKPRDIVYFNNLELLEQYKKLCSLHPECQSLLEYSLFSSVNEPKLQKLVLFSKNKNGFCEKHIKYVKGLSSHISRLCGLMANSSEVMVEIPIHEDECVSPEQMVLRCSGLREISAHIRNIAKTDTTVLIYGETGVGKEVIADTLYSLSSRSKSTFEKINCGSFAPSLIDSELFGVVKGAYTGAVESRKGIFESANGGTLFLDEIGELSLDVQARLLRVLESKEIRRVGDTKIIPIDVRIIAATNRDLELMVEEGTFRRDLFYRISAFPLYIPSLAERLEDIPVLAQHFYNELVKKLKLKSPPKLTEETIQDLLKRSWAGNVRQLKFSIERSLIICCNQEILHIYDSIGSRSALVRIGRPSTPLEILTEPKPLILDERDGDFVEILSALRRCQNRIEGPFGAAKLLNVNPSTFRYKMRKFGIKRQKNSK